MAKGTLREPGMWPERRPWRGSGAVPSKRAAARASTICAALLPIRPFTSATSRTSSALSMAVKWRSLRAARLAVLERAALGLPFLQAAVQHAHVLVAHGAEHPPHARRRVEALAVVGDDVHAVADAHLLHAAGELARARAACAAAARSRRRSRRCRRTARPGCARPGTRPWRRAWRWAGAWSRRGRRGRARRGARPASRSRPAICQRRRPCVSSPGRLLRWSRGRQANDDADAPVQLALLLDLGDGDRADLAGARTCVPPQGCRSTQPSSPMTTRRTRPVPIGGFTDMVRTRPGLASSSASVIQRSLTGWSAAISALRSAVSLSLSTADGVLDVEVEPAVVGVDLAAGDGELHQRAEQMQAGVHAHEAVSACPSRARRARVWPGCGARRALGGTCTMVVLSAS